MSYMLYQEIFRYLLIASLLMGIFYGYYFIALRRETSFQFNRFYLLVGILLSLVFPLIRIPSPVVVDIPTFHTLAEVVIVANGTSVQASLFSWEMILYSFYLLGLAVSFWLLTQRFWKMWRFILDAEEKEENQDHTLIYTKGELSTASFLRFLFWDDSKDLDEQALAQIKAHELCHIRQKHSYDIIFIEIIGLIFWFNPFIYFIRRDLVQTHEYLADRAALNIGTPKNYKRLMLSQALNTRFVLAHTFFQSPIKNRINMLNNESNQRKLIVIAILLLPILGGLFFFSTFVKKIDIHVVMEPSAYESYEETPEEEIEDEFEERERKEIIERKKQIERRVEEITASSDPDINAFIFAEKEPKPLNMGDIQRAIGYPQIARDAGIDGNVIVRVLVDETGKYSRHKVISQVHPVLTKAVEEHIDKLRFTPAIQGGKPTKFWVNIPFNFKLLN